MPTVEEAYTVSVLMIFRGCLSLRSWQERIAQQQGVLLAVSRDRDVRRKRNVKRNDKHTLQSVRLSVGLAGGGALHSSRLYDSDN